MTNNITNEQIINAIDNEQIKALMWHAKGLTIQHNYHGDLWKNCDSDGPVFVRGTKYRVKPVEKKINTYLLKADDGQHYAATEETMRVQTNTFEAEIVKKHTFTYTEEE